MLTDQPNTIHYRDRAGFEGPDEDGDCWTVIGKRRVCTGDAEETKAYYLKLGVSLD
jgi:hypothetical protein